MTRRRARRSQLPLIALGGEVVHEHLLPKPWVQYPPIYGVFHGFAADEAGPFCFCLCQKDAMENLFRLADREEARISHSRSGEIRGGWPKSVAPFAAGLFETGRESIDALPWGEGLCHRCAQLPPSLRWSHEMYNGQFKQFHGWYVVQTMLRLGFFRYQDDFLEDSAPAEIIALHTDVKAAVARSIAATQPDGTADRELQAQIPKAKRKFDNAVENISRAEFGQRPVGDRWIAETQLAQLVGALLHGEELIRHHRPKWLAGLELDIWLPHRQWAIEYQGQQHFRSIMAWGGRPALEELQARDERKRLLCATQGVRLIEFDYTEPLTAQHVASRLGLVA
jgi:hypothetical protein